MNVKSYVLLGDCFIGLFTYLLHMEWEILGIILQNYTMRSIIKKKDAMRSKEANIYDTKGSVTKCPPTNGG